MGVLPRLFSSGSGRTTAAVSNVVYVRFENHCHMQVLVHGGAGTEPDDPETRRAVLEQAAADGAAESTTVDAVEAAVRVLESSPRFNAGVGGAVQSDGEIRTDAGIMTDDRAVGAACSMPGVEHAINVARVVMEETPHGFVSGEHAIRLAETYGIETGVDLWSERTRKRWAELDPATGVDAELEWIREQYGRSDPDGREDGDTSTEEPPADLDHDTVGAVAFDGESLAAATSTGGRWLALAGRVGDVPQVGSGFYCCPAAAVSATGAGEDIARVTLSRRVARHVERGLEASVAAELAIEEFAELTGSTAGVICIDARGTLGSAYNSTAMQTARASSGDD
ncbi:Isoaspartyl peptidase or L-asparaginase, Ntn-hydrolase superfamily [Natrarchaeobaculum sulfurireducens]|uniref:Plant-type L-asparaginase n=2 Tax=Natrarchaeobaculum sulfurireducens TaxID=2044521 RepID=A0A346PIQ3_9EURY|nr:Isoaspartyl peptidase or L-asparaginase, Ntn-hydrolase superfamily [Natrarchaeobaculum sulfurireducens]